ncbi:Grainyhead-like protein [Penicillium cinerascens]|uniref:Grainyhead-like protein n=1 Tax=Penicillium cinerascens TaxID=70096 RepID=A0A9W9TAD6_9EURO|nr:Grainyhead-like protein [Penicillium cinerascens]KAJ5215493.1 Grainyhead-like protein [Penicillium cinerascens]
MERRQEYAHEVDHFGFDPVPPIARTKVRKKEKNSTCDPDTLECLNLSYEVATKLSLKDVAPHSEPKLHIRQGSFPGNSPGSSFELPDKGNTWLSAQFSQKYADHFQPTKFAFPTLSNEKFPIINDGLNERHLERGTDLDLQDLDLTPTAESTQMTWAQEGALLTLETASKPQQLPLCIYFRLHKDEGYYGDDDIFRAVYLQERTAEMFVRGVCAKFPIDVTCVREVLFLDSNGIINRTDDEILQELPNEQTLDIEFVPVHAGFTSTSSAVSDVKMRVHL